MSSILPYRMGRAVGLFLLVLSAGHVEARTGDEDEASADREVWNDKSQIADFVAKATGTKKLKANQIVPSLMDNFWELRSDKPADGALLVAKDSRRLMLGRIYEEEAGRMVEITGAMSRTRMLAALPEEDFIVFAPEGQPTRASIWVFTDVTCTYCRRMHGDIQDYLEQGIAVRYLPFPRYGKGSDSWLQTSRAWCAADRPTTLTALKKGKEAGTACAQGDALDHFIDLAGRIGVVATPTIILPDGRKLDGLTDARALAVMLFPPANPE